MLRLLPEAGKRRSFWLLKRGGKRLSGIPKGLTMMSSRTPFPSNPLKNKMGTIIKFCLIAVFAAVCVVSAGLKKN